MFNLSYLVDNGRFYGWASCTEENCSIVQWRDDGTFSVLDSARKPIGSGDTADDAIRDARMNLTHRRRVADGVIAARVA